MYFQYCISKFLCEWRMWISCDQKKSFRLHHMRITPRSSHKCSKWWWKTMGVLTELKPMSASAKNNKTDGGRMVNPSSPTAAANINNNIRSSPFECQQQKKVRNIYLRNPYNITVWRSKIVQFYQLLLHLHFFGNYIWIKIAFSHRCGDEKNKTKIIILMCGIRSPVTLFLWRYIYVILQRN